MDFIFCSLKISKKAGIISGKDDKEEKHLQTKLITLIVDNEFPLTIDLKENNNYNNSNIQQYDDDDDQVGLATYTNSEARIETFSSMFEILWIQSEKNCSSSLIAWDDNDYGNTNNVKNYSSSE